MSVTTTEIDRLVVRLRATGSYVEPRRRAIDLIEEGHASPEDAWLAQAAASVLVRDDERRLEG